MAVLRGAPRDVDLRGMERDPILNARARPRSPLQGLPMFPLLADPSLLYARSGPQYGVAPFVATLLLMIPVTDVAQHVRLRHGAVSQKGHAERILDRIGRFRSIFSMVELVRGNYRMRVTGSASMLQGGASPCP